MSGDGVSMPTTLSQMGRVAKAQARGQQQNQQVTPFSEQQEKRDQLKLQKVRETQETEKQRIDPDEEEKDKRKRRRLARKSRCQQPSGADEENADRDQPQADDGDEALGVTIDLMA